ncbi:tripartite ATP-independent periplasmic transporter DctQ component [Hyphomonas adhaerens MHS-3]|uniref:TRAP transporter small permease protein n=1 Tax=Hyphomonas adhaerens MHS-3 TaxID=1280949 RepID=A0A069E7Y8_9PROT|nr:TRAP transporter small permease subunit [Hyphomonas adhaerens]KCZ86193.1 tripartite ATP-independent periplasmic transporter DctQ component [Hyphomonas adhaerens MHS-3]
MSEAPGEFNAFLINADRRLNTGLLWAASGLLSLMVLLVMIQIVARYVLQDAPAWTEEGARYCMVWSALLAATCAFYEGADPALIKVDAGSPPALQKARSWLRFMCVLVFSGTLLVYSPGMILRSALRQSEALGVNLALVTMVVPVFALVILFHAFVQILTGRAAERRVT